MKVPRESVLRAICTRDCSLDAFSADLAPTRTHVYGYQDSAGVLLYVGITRDPLTRDKAHAWSSAWYKHVHRRVVLNLDLPRALAEEVERMYIRTLSPVFNFNHAAPYWRALRKAYESRDHTVITVSTPDNPKTEYRLTCWLCPKWEAIAGNVHEAERWRDEHIACAF